MSNENFVTRLATSLVRRGYLSNEHGAFMLAERESSGRHDVTSADVIAEMKRIESEVSK